MGKANSNSLLDAFRSKMTRSGRARTGPSNYLRMMGEDPLEEEGARQDPLH
jgi:hypothetical protein